MPRCKSNNNFNLKKLAQKSKRSVYTVYTIIHYTVIESYLYLSGDNTLGLAQPTQHLHTNIHFYKHFKDSLKNI
jgi:hypothetical protein